MHPIHQEKTDMASRTDQKSEGDIKIIDLTPQNIANYGVCGYKDVRKHLELRRKIDWFNEYYPMGLRIKVLFSETGGYQGMLEYIPGKYAHRPVEAEGYMFIHCLFVGFKNEYKGKGHASSLIEECIQDSKRKNMRGVAVVTRKGPFMAKRDIFVKKGFVLVDKAEPDFELLVLKFNQKAADPKFKNMSLKGHQRGLTIIRSPQCPYSVKNVDAIVRTAIKLKMETNVIDLKDSSSVQNAPCAFGTFCIVHNGKIISHYPISNTRFLNIIKSK
jgi:hypothetical protein